MSGLFGSSILEVLIGLFLVYFILSTICSHINELIAILLKWRAKDLELGLQNLLCDPDLAEKVRNNQLIKALGNTDAETALVRVFNALSSGWSKLITMGGTAEGRFRHQKPDAAGWPSYIPADVFARALFDVMATSATDPENRQVSVVEIKAAAKQMIDTGQQAADAKRLINSTRPGKAAVATPPPTTPPSAKAEDAIRPMILQIAAVASASEPPAALSLEDLGAEIEKWSGDPNKDVARRAASTLVATAAEYDKASKKKDDKWLQRVYEAANKKLDSVVAGGNFGRAILNLTRDLGTVNTKDTKLTDQQLNDIKQRVIDILRAANAISLGTVDLSDQINRAARLQDIRDVIMQLPTESTVQKTALGFLNNVQDGLDKALKTLQAELETARKNIEDWFNDSMDRVSGVYKRRTQMWVLFIGLFLVVFLGVDTFRLVGSLANDPAKRAVLVATANSVINPGAGVSATPTGTVSAATPSATVASSNVISDTGQALSNLQDDFKQFDALNLPIGYGDAPDVSDPKYKSPNGLLLAQYNSDWWAWFGRRIAGLLVTTLAVSLGAPFWFQVLNKVANIRGSGSPPPKSDDGTAQDQKK